jgi:hypothetical protein
MEGSPDGDPHFLMERRMLLGIKQRSEASRG